MPDISVIPERDTKHVRGLTRFDEVAANLEVWKLKLRSAHPSEGKQTRAKKKTKQTHRTHAFTLISHGIAKATSVQRLCVWIWALYHTEHSILTLTSRRNFDAVP